MMFKRKRKKTGTQVPPQGHIPTMPALTNPPNRGSSVQPPKQPCPYETPCGWCTKWDKKCDKKIGHKKDKDLEDIKSGKGLTSACVFREPWRSAVP